MNRLPLAAVLLAWAAPAMAQSTLAPDAEARWVPFDLTPGNQIRFAMTVDGKSVVAVLDTGVSYSVVARRSAAIDPARVTTGGSATAIGGAVTIGRLTTTTVTIGGLTRRGGDMAVADLPASATGSATAVDVLVGRDLLSDYALDIDYAGRRFRLIPSGRLPFTGATAPLTISAARKVYETALTVGGRRLAPVVVDTGDGAAVTLSAAAWASAGVTGLPTTTTIGFGLAGTSVSSLAILPTLSLGSLTAREVELRVEPSGGFSQRIGVAGRIGSGFLQNYRVLLDPRAGRMVLQPAAAPTPLLRSTSGLLLGLATDRLRVIHVMRGGPAAAAGWREGDQICAVDGTPVTPGFAAGPKATWTVGPPGTVVRLTLCSGDVRTLTLSRFY